MQCTGLRDCEGKLIYEGDIVCIEDAKEKLIAVIAWNSLRMQWMCNEFEKGEACGGYGFGSYNHQGFIIKVVGNIYENPELLYTESEKSP